MTKGSDLMRADTFKNPFDENNANTIESQKILELWCDPFLANNVKGMDYIKFATSRIPIILQGSRGSGKTTILKYFSYQLQRERAKRDNVSVLKLLNKENSIGFYYRCDDSFINTFKSIFNSQSPDHWLTFFDHYLELCFSSQLVELIDDLKEGIDNSEAFEMQIIDCFCKSVIEGQFRTVKSIGELHQLIEDELCYIDKFKNEVILSDCTEFVPSSFLSLYTITLPLINSICDTVPKLKDSTFLILVDEFENLTSEIQKYFNTKIKFVKNQITFRVGRRSEGTVTTATINNDEYLRRDHDYQLALISSEDMNLKSQRDHFLTLANKRLAAANFHSQKSIIDIIGDKENLDEECLGICKCRDKHLHEVLSEKACLRNDDQIRNKVIDIIKYPENPIAETLNALWVIRSNRDPLEAASIAKKAMNDFFNKEKNAASNKYKLDYSDKYRYSITVLLASIYKKQKMYYGFNAITMLADGNARTFINICRFVFNDALFYERSLFFSDQLISKESQSRAIHEFSFSEYQSICSIINYGKKIESLILNIGNIFMDYHKDKRVRYPETTQFSFDKSNLYGEDLEVINTAISWSMICKREKTQRISASTKNSGELYYISRAFSPMFGISYRIRGGVNVFFSHDEMTQMMVTSVKISKLDKKKNNVTSDTSSDFPYQLNLFDIMGGNQK